MDKLPPHGGRDWSGTALLEFIQRRVSGCRNNNRNRCAVEPIKWLACPQQKVWRRGVTLFGNFSGNLDLVTGGVSFLLTLMVLSYLIGDNPAFRVAVYIFIGVAAGYAAAVVWHQVLDPHLLSRYFPGAWQIVWWRLSR